MCVETDLQKVSCRCQDETSTLVNLQDLFCTLVMVVRTLIKGDISVIAQRNDHHVVIDMVSIYFTPSTTY